jgi:hypothetical protein
VHTAITVAMVVSTIFTADILGVTAPERHKTIITIKDVQ